MTFGGTEWNVFSCNETLSLVIVAAESNPAFPFYFFYHPNGNAYRLFGEGTGDKGASRAAYDELSKLTFKDFAALFAATQAVPRKQ